MRVISVCGQSIVLDEVSHFSYYNENNVYYTEIKYSDGTVKNYTLYNLPTDWFSSLYDKGVIDLRNYTLDSIYETSLPYMLQETMKQLQKLTNFKEDVTLYEVVDALRLDCTQTIRTFSKDIVTWGNSQIIYFVHNFPTVADALYHAIKSGHRKFPEKCVECFILAKWLVNNYDSARCYSLDCFDDWGSSAVTLFIRAARKHVQVNRAKLDDDFNVSQIYSHNITVLQHTIKLLLQKDALSVDNQPMQYENAFFITLWSAEYPRMSDMLAALGERFVRYAPTRITDYLQ